METWNQDRQQKKDESVINFEEEYGNYVEKDLIPQLTQLAALKLTANPLKYTISTGNETVDDIFQERVDDIIGNIDINSIAFVLEETLSREGNATLVFSKKSNDEFDIYVPTTSITRVNPSSGDIVYLQVIRYLWGGDLVNVVSELHTLEEISYSFHEFNSLEEAQDSVKAVKDKKTKKLGGKELSAEEAVDRYDDLKGGDYTTKKNELGFIQAVYFENIPTVDKRGRPDFNRNSRYEQLLNKTMIRFYWELEFNKSKFIEQEEMGQNIFGSEFRTQQNQSQVMNNYVKRTNNFGLSMGNAGSGYQYFETTNQNMVNLIQLFNYFIKKWWEQSGQHQSGSDIGKQISDLQAEMERGAEHLRFKKKALDRQTKWRELLWKMFRTMDDKEFGTYGEKPKGLKKSNIKFNITYAKVDIEKLVIENEIMKLQSNLTNREEAIARIQQLSPDADIVKLSKKYLEDNLQDIKEQQIEEGETYQAKPVQVQNPSMNNPQGSTNNQSKKFHQQKSGDKPVTVKGKNGTTFQRAAKGMGEGK